MIQPKLGTIEYLGTKYAYNISNETKDKIIDTLLAYYAKHGVCGEGLMQDDDDAQTYAPDVLADIADDLIQFTEIGDIE